MSLGTHIVPFGTRHVLRLESNKNLMRNSNVATTMNVYGSATLKAKQKAKSRFVQMVIAQPMPQSVAD